MQLADGTDVSDINMDKVYKKYKEMKMNPQKLMDELGIDINSDGDHLGMGIVRKEADLSNEEKQYLLAMERGDIPTVRTCLEEALIYFNININCVDPLGRTALLISIENENIEMIEMLLNYNIEVGDALLHAINEENVEAVEMLLVHQQNNKKDLSVSKIFNKYFFLIFSSYFYINYISIFLDRFFSFASDKLWITSMGIHCTSYCV